MKVKRYELSQALSVLCKVAEKKSSMPILTTVAFELVDGMVRLSATDLVSVARYECYCEFDSAENMGCVPAHDLYKLVKTVKTDKSVVQFDWGMDFVTVTVGTNQARFRSYPIIDTPKMDFLFTDNKSICKTIVSDFVSGLEYCFPAISQDDTRQHINVVAIDCHRIIATDGHRMHIAPFYGSINQQILIPRLAVNQLVGMLKTTSEEWLGIEYGGNKIEDHERAVFCAGPYSLAVKLPYVKFPDYEVFANMTSNRDKSTEWIVPVKQSVAAFKASVAENKAVKLTMNGVIKVESRNVELETESSQTIDPIYGHFCENATVIAVNGRYLAEAFSGNSDRATISVENTLDPIVVKVGDFAAVVMPMRI